MYRLILLGVLALGLIPAVAFGSPKKTALEAKLAGKNEVPKAGVATGEAYLTFTGAKVCWRFEDLKAFTGATAAHIHKAGAGKSGPVVVPLGGAFKPAGCITSTAAIVRGILANPKAYYVNIHTKKFPGGALRGQLAEED